MDYDYGNHNGELLAVFLAFYAAFFVFAILVSIGSYVVMAAALMTFFKKVGVEPWIAWVPVYNNWKWLEVGGQKGWLALLQFIPYGGIATAVFLYIGMYRTGIAFGKDPGFLVLGIFLPFVWAFILGGATAEYRPERISRAGFPPPYAGHGAVPEAARI